MSSYKLNSWGFLPPLKLAGLDQNAISTTNSDGGLTSSTKYYWTMTLYDNLTGVESPAVNSRPAGGGAFVLDPFNASIYAPDAWSATTGSSDNTGNLTFAEIQAVIVGAYVDARATHFKLYRTDVNADAFKLCTNLEFNGITITPTGGVSSGSSLPDGSVSIADFIAGNAALLDDTADSDLGIILDTTKGPPPSVNRMLESYNKFIGGAVSTSFGTYKHIKVFRDSVFGIGQFGLGMGGDSLNSYSGFDSVLNIHEPFLPEYVAISLDINNGDGQRPTGIGVLGDSTLLIFKERSTYYLLGTDPSNYTRRVMDTRRGCIHASTIQESPIGVFTLDYSGIVLFDGSGPGKTLSNPDVDDVIRRINLSASAIKNSYSGYDNINEVYYVAVPVDGSTVANTQIIYSVRSQGFSILNGVEGASLKFVTNSSNQELSMVGGKTSGLLLDWSDETDTTFLAQPITSTYTSGPMFFGDPAKRKRTHFVYITAETAQDFTIDINLIIDYGQVQFTALQNVNSASLYSVYAASLSDSGANVGVWDSSYWGDVKTQKAIKVPINAVGYVFQVQIINRQSDDNKYGFKILAVDLEATIMGR